MRVVDVGGVRHITGRKEVVGFVRGTAGGHRVLLAELPLVDEVAPVVDIPQFPGIGIDPAGGRIDQVGVHHGCRTVVSRTGRHVVCPRYIIIHPVVQSVLFGKSRSAACIVEQVLAGEQGRIFMAHVRIAEVGRIQLLAAVTHRVVDALPHHFVVIFNAANQLGLVISNHVDTPFAFEGDLRFALLAAFGGYHNHTVGTARTPQGGRSGILQNGDRFHIFRVHRRKDVLAVSVSISIGYTVHNDQSVRIALAGRTYTADTDTHIQTGLTVDGRYLQTRDGSFQCIG